MNQQGVATARCGRDLTQELGAPYVVYHDHGDREQDANVAACKAFYGTPEVGVRNANRLADVDVLIADSVGRALIFVEIEERPSSPKKILGDIFALAMANHVAVGRGDQEIFTIGVHTHLIVAGVLSEKGAVGEKLETVIGPRLSSFRREEDGLPLRNVRLVFRASIEEAVEGARAAVRAALAASEAVADSEGAVVTGLTQGVADEDPS